MLSTGSAVRFIGKRELEAKLLAAAPRILEENRAMVTEMLETIKPIVAEQTPTGPGHFGYHGRDTLKVEVSSAGVKTTGTLKAAVQLYWREFGTRGRFRKGSQLSRYVRALESNGGGERAFMPAHKALAGVRRFLRFYYGNAQWWRL